MLEFFFFLVYSLSSWLGVVCWMTITRWAIKWLSTVCSCYCWNSKQTTNILKYHVSMPIFVHFYSFDEIGFRIILMKKFVCFPGFSVDLFALLWTKMLCTSMRLTERRFRIETTLRSSNNLNTARITIGNGSPFVRPCTIIKMFNDNENDNNTGKSITTLPRRQSNGNGGDSGNTTNKTERISRTDRIGSPDTKNQTNNNR